MIEPTFTKAELLSFIESSTVSGQVNTHTGNAWKAASTKVLSELADTDSVQGYDTLAAIHRYANRNPGEVAGDSLKKYEQRTRSAIEQFIAWKKDPLNYKPPSRGLALTTATPAKKVIRRTLPAKTAATPTPAPAPAANGVVHPLTPPPNLQIASLPVQIPIRGGKFIVQLSIPVDLTTEEANRITTVIQAFGQAPSPESFA